MPARLRCLLSPWLSALPALPVLSALFYLRGPRPYVFELAIILVEL
jgi:hypothetical protein